jgi:uncharacterized protein YjbJ (UPF0337 family)
MTIESGHETKAEGTGDQLRGELKEGVGEMTGDRALERQGEREQKQGALKKAWGNLKNAFGGNKH